MTFVIAHRGLSAQYLENSLEAIAAGLKHTPVVEIDVRSSHDAVPVCAHDRTASRAHNVDLHIGRVDFDELRDRIPALPTLAEALDVIADHDGAAMLDIKVSRPRAIEQIERVVAASRLRWNDGKQLRVGEPISPLTVTFQSGDAQLLQAVRSRTGAGCLELISRQSSVRELVLTSPFISAYAQGVTVPAEFVTRAMIRSLHLLRLGTYAYTVNDESTMQRMADCNVRGVYTDDASVFAEKFADAR